MKKNYIELFKVGKFYSAYGDDGIILHNLLGYKYVSYKNSVGFPETALEKVKNVLKEEKIQYKIYEKNNLIEEGKGIVKNYEKVLKTSIKKYEIEERYNRLKRKIDECNEDELEKMLEGIENIVN